MYKRVELHNHTVESDGKMTVEELIQYFHAHRINCFSLTDHNTISGHRKLKNVIETSGLPMEYIYGYELTSYYGHILCQNVPAYIPWDDIDKNNADILLERVHNAGGLVGIAHPFSVGAPISNGMQFSMQIHDHHLLDFIEIINNAHLMIPDNHKAILWWEALLFSGHRIAPVSGMDFHRPCDMSDYFTTYIDIPDTSRRDTLAEQFTKAVTNCKTCITKGPIIKTNLIKTSLSIKLHYEEDGFSNQFDYKEPLSLKIKTASNEIVASIEESITMDIHNLISSPDRVIILELYKDTIEWQNLIAIGAPVFLEADRSIEVVQNS